jgi:hypothetical protein
VGAPVYATREQVKNALDSVETARNNRRIDRLIRASSRSVEKLTLRKFYPTLGTRTFDWPDEQDQSMPWRLWLGENEMAAAPTAITSGGDALALGDVYARPDTGPPFDHLEVVLSSSAAWSSGSSRQRAISAASTYGYQLDEVLAADLAAEISTATATTCDVTGNVEIGVGSLLRIGTERLNVTGRSMITTGQTLQVPMDAQLNSQSVAVTNGAAFVEDEIILLNSEKMRIDEIAGNTLIVKRAWDGSSAATHNGSTIYAARRLTIERAQCGTSAPSTHSSGADVYAFRFPDLVNQLTIAKTIVSLLQESAGYGRTVGAGDNQREAAGKALAELEKQVKRGFYRYRTGAI